MSMVRNRSTETLAMTRLLNAVGQRRGDAPAVEGRGEDLGPAPSERAAPLRRREYESADLEDRVTVMAMLC